MTRPGARSAIVQVIVQDLVVLKRYFVQRDASGLVLGLEEERVAPKTARLEILANRVLRPRPCVCPPPPGLACRQHAAMQSKAGFASSANRGPPHQVLAEPTERLLELYHDAATPEHDPRSLVDRACIFGALQRRPEKAAVDLVRDMRKRKA